MKKKKKKIKRPPIPSFLPKGIGAAWSTVEYYEDKTWKKKTFQHTSNGVKFYWQKDREGQKPRIRRATLAEAFPIEITELEGNTKPIRTVEFYYVVPPPPAPKNPQPKYNKRGEEMFTGVQKCVAKFMEEWDGRPDTNGREIVEGCKEYYLGLYDYLYEAGFKKSAKRMIEPGDGSFLRDINAAWRLYRQKHPFKVRPLDDENSFKEPQSNGPPERRKKFWGHNVSSIIRALGKEGMNFKEVRQVMDHYKVDVLDKTIKGQLWCGTKRGKFGSIPKLQEWQLNELFSAVSKKEKSISKKS